MKPTHVRTVGRAADGGIRLAILAVVVTGIRQRNPGAVANGLVAFAATFLPTAFAYVFDLTLDPRHRLWVSGSVFLHAFGMLGPYDDTWWWDHLTHVLSASLVGAAAHLVARRRGADPIPAVLGATVGLGLFWEGIEYLVRIAADRLGLTPLLVQYGREDTILDVVFDFLGGLLVVAFGPVLLDGTLEEGAQKNTRKSGSQRPKRPT